MHARCPTDRIGVSEQRSLFVGGIQKASIRFGWKGLSTAHAYHAILGVACPVSPHLSDKRNPVNVWKPIQSFLGPRVVPERSGCVGTGAAHSEACFIEQC